MSEKDDFADLVVSARNATKSSSFYFCGRIRYGTKGDKVEDRFLCMDDARVYICSVRIPVKIESQFNILSIKSIDKLTDSHVTLEIDGKQSHSLYGFHDKASLQPFLVVLIRIIRSVFPHRLLEVMSIRPENECERLLRISDKYFDDKSISTNVCGGFSPRYECACDFYQVQCHDFVSNLVDTVFANRSSREFTFREFESLAPKDWISIIGALRYNEWFEKLTVENVKLSTECIDEFIALLRSNKTIKHVRLANCGLSKDFATKLGNVWHWTYFEHIDLSNNPIEDKGLSALSTTLQQRRVPLRSIDLQSCSITHKALQSFTGALTNSLFVKNLHTLNLTGNRIKDEMCITVLFNNSDNVLENLYISDIEFSIDWFFSSLSSLPCKLRRLHITSAKAVAPPTVATNVKSFFAKTKTLEILQLSNANLSVDFLRDLCEGLHENAYLKSFDLNISGNQLESFVRDNAKILAKIPFLTALDISGCDLENEALPLLIVLRDSPRLVSLSIGKNYNSTKPKQLQKIVSAMKALVTDNKLEYFSIADSKLREYTAELLASLVDNTSITTLDIRGNLMGDTSARTFAQLLQINCHLNTIHFDRNLLTLNSFEDIVNAMEQNRVIQHLPIPISDIILMKTSEKERMEKLQSLIHKLDFICTRNQRKHFSLTSSNLSTKTRAILAYHLGLSWENQHKLLGDQLTLEYVQSCSNRSNIMDDEDVRQILSKPAIINEVSSQLDELYLTEGKRFTEEWNNFCKSFEQQLVNTQKNLLKKFYHSFKEKSLIKDDEAFQKELQGCIVTLSNNIHQLLTEQTLSEIASEMAECYIGVSTRLQEFAYTRMDRAATHMHEKLESNIEQLGGQHTAGSQSGSSSSTSTLDRLLHRANHTGQRAAFKPDNQQSETSGEVVTSRPSKKTDSDDYPSQSSSTALQATPKDIGLSPAAANKGVTSSASVSPKPPRDVSQSHLISSIVTEPEPAKMYDNFSGHHQTKIIESPVEDEGIRIEHELLDIVAKEQDRDKQKSASSEIPVKNGTAAAESEDDLNVNVEQTQKLVHLGKERPRREVRRPARRTLEGPSRDSSSDGTLNVDDGNGSIPINPTTETSNANFPSTPILETPSADVQSTVVPRVQLPSKPPKPINDESHAPPVPVKTRHPMPSPQARHSYIPTSDNVLPRSSTAYDNNNTPQLANSDRAFDMQKSKVTTSMSPSMAKTSSNRDEQKDGNDSTDTLLSQPPPVAARPAKAAVGTRVLPPTAEALPIKLKHFQSDKKVEASTANDVKESSTTDQDEQYKPISVKERARLLATSNSAPTHAEKKA